jgi:hypothetical protein
MKHLCCRVVRLSQFLVVIIVTNHQNSHAQAVIQLIRIDGRFGDIFSAMESALSTHYLT